MRIVSCDVCGAIGFHTVAVIGAVGVRGALGAVFRNRETVARCVLGGPGKHSDGHDRIAAGGGDVGNELSGIVVKRVAGIAERAVREIPVGRCAGIKIFPVVARGGVATPADERRAAVCYVGCVRGEVHAIHVGADCVAIAERVYRDLNCGGDGIRWRGAGLGGVGASAGGVER